MSFKCSIIKFVSTCFLLGAFSLTSTAVFIPGFDDIPLMEGVEVDPDGVVLFDTPSGRIGSLVAVTSDPINKVYDYYALTLRELGWVKIKAGEYIREGERLEIDEQFPRSGEQTAIRISVAPIVKA